MKVLFLANKEDLLFRDNMLAIAMQTAIDYPYISLILSAGVNRADYEKCFENNARFVQEKGAYNRPKGLEYLLHKKKMGLLTQEDIENVFVPAVDNHLYYLPEDENKRKVRNEISNRERSELVNGLDEYADIVFVNGAGDQSLLKGQMSEEADLVIIGIDAHLANCDDLLLLPAKIREKSLFLLSGYEACSHNNMSQLTKYYRLDEERILTIPPNAVYSQASLRGKGEEFLKRTNFSYMTNGCKFFLGQLKRSVNLIVDSLDF